MNLTRLFEVQRKLDAEIEKKHPTAEGEDRLAKRILALQVEAGELMNELPEIFKFWSNKKNNYEKALTEYVDGIHFILSIGLDEEVLGAHYRLVDEIVSVQEKDLISQFDMIFHYLHDFRYQDYTYVYPKLLKWYLGLGEMLGFTWEQIETAYMEKNAINHERQENGY